MPYTQTNRQFALTTDLGEDVLLLQSMSGREELGRLCEYHLFLLSEDPDIAVDDILGTSATVRITLAGDAGERYINGYVTRFVMTGMKGRFYTYEARLSPWLWFLTQSSNCRIFQNLSASDVIRQVFDRHSMPDYEFSLSATYAVREYCVQYRETDFDFVSRLMEEEGMYHFVRHENGRHVVVVADSFGAHAAIDGDAELEYRPHATAQNRRDDILFGWASAAEVHTQSCVLNDYDFVNPRADLLVTSSIVRGHANAQHERYDYPGLYAPTDRGTGLARNRIESLQAMYRRASASTCCRRVYAGGLFTLTAHPRAEENREYLIIAVGYTLDNGSYETQGGGVEEYSCQILCQPSQEPFRALALTPRPVVRGPHTAVVVGASGEKIWTDEYGRVKLQFHWDRDGTENENSSCWVRVAHAWVGSGWNNVFLPRLGDEVVVSFLEGDPDRPLVTGSVHNAINMPLYTLPDNQTRSWIKTRSVPSDDAEAFNELRFEDKVGEEEVYFHAEKDMNRVVENNDTVKVGFEKADPGDQTVNIKNDQTTDIGHDQTTTIGNVCLFEAQTSIELKVGTSSIKIEPAKITIKTTQLSMEGTAQVEMKSSGPVTIQGAVVKIN